VPLLLRQYAKNHGSSLQQVLTCVTVDQDASLLGGTASAAAYQLGEIVKIGNNKP
jgi:hypothetical protein